MTVTAEAPASRHRVTSVATTWGLVVMAYSGARSMEMLGLTTTLWPFLTNRSILPNARMARRVIPAGSSPRATDR